jgi:ABC-type transport system substrate-binding protein
MKLIATGLLALSLVTLLAPSAQAADDKKVLRYAFRVAETGFDPARIQDLYSRMITPHIFESLVTYDHLARPAKLKPLTAESLPEPNADFTVWTARIKPGIFFTDDPAFGGKKRELVAQDYVYSFTRYADPAIPSPGWTAVETWGIKGLKEAREKAQSSKKPFDYDTPIAGLGALDRYTVRFTLTKPNPRFLQELGQTDLYGAVAREVVEKYGDQIMAHPVGTGPFVLKQWRRASLIVLERNAAYRERFYDAEPNADDAEGQAMLAKFKGRRLPMIDRVEVSIIDENQPRWLSFLNGQHDFIERVPEDFISLAAPNGQLAPNLAKQGMQLYRVLNSEVFFHMFNMDDPVVGGMAPAQVALRRAISLGMDTEAEIRLVRRGQAVPAQSTYVPNTSAYDPTLKTENSEFNPAKAKGLLDTFGYVDRDGDGCRDGRDGKPLGLVMNTSPDTFQRQLDERFEKDMRRINICVQFNPAKWPEQLRAARSGHYQMWPVAQAADKPDSLSSLARLHGAQIGSNNLSRFNHPEVNALYEQAAVMPDGPERLAVFRRAALIGTAFMPIKFKGHRFLTDITRAQMSGYRRPLFWQNWWEYIDIDPSKVPQ